MPNDVTARGFPLPHPDNIAREDAGHIRTAIQTIDEQMTDLEGREATESGIGNVRLATEAEATAGTSTTRVPVVKRVADMIAAAIDDVADTVDDFITSVTTALGTKASKSANLSDLTDKTAARTALGLAAAALKGLATIAQIRSKTGTDLISVDAAWDAAKWVPLGNLTGAITIDASTGARFWGTLTGNVTIDVTNAKDGQPFEFAAMQDATGGRTVSWNAKFKWPSAAPPEVATAANNYAVIMTGDVAWNGDILAAGWKVTP
jgi:hypothetical protein